MLVERPDDVSSDVSPPFGNGGAQTTGAGPTYGNVNVALGRIITYANGLSSFLPCTASHGVRPAPVGARGADRRTGSTLGAGTAGDEGGLPREREAAKYGC
jgi:hypothetical protein